MEHNVLTENPFAVLTFIAAPAILTNATSVLAMSTINRMLRTRDRMHDLYAESENAPKSRGVKFVEHVNRVERQALLLLNALRWIYTALGAFAAAALVTLLGSVVGQLRGGALVHVIVGSALALGFLGIAGLIGGCVNLFRATQLSLANIHEEAKAIRERQKQHGENPA